MSWLTQLQQEVRHRFGLDVEDGSSVVPELRPGTGLVTTRHTLGRTPVESENDPAKRASSTPCAMPDCEFPAEGICCRTHRIDFSVLLLEDDLLRLGTDWLLWIQELRPL